MADRVRLQTTRLTRAYAPERGRILAAADALVLLLYHHVAPEGWRCGWCDASVARKGSERRVGVGAIIFDESGQEVCRISKRIAEREPFEAEIAALETTLEAALAHDHRANCMRVYTDCPALVSLWLRDRRDPRLSVVRELTRKLRRFELRGLPRRHNRLTHHLARDAAYARS